MVDYRDHFDTHPNIHSYRERQSSSLLGPLIALGVVLLLIGSVFFLSSGTSIDVDSDASAPMANEAAPAAPAEPAAQ